MRRTSKTSSGHTSTQSFLPSQRERSTTGFAVPGAALFTGAVGMTRGAAGLLWVADGFGHKNPVRGAS
jgi:hypothetical protein